MKWFGLRLLIEALVVFSFVYFTALKMLGSEIVRECQPIKCYENVMSFKQSFPACSSSVCTWMSNSTEFCVPGSEVSCHHKSANLTEHHKLRTSVPKTLFCHDLKGGYLEDRCINGSTVHDEYRFFHWAVIDIFVYFSHHLVTIPPPMWINAAHLHGTKVLGTLITEWKEGEKVWENILENEESVEQFIDCLVNICCNFGFDGYLLNVENNIDSQKISLLELFVSMLHSKLHSKLPHSEVIWYDSVTTFGGLRWQNELNELNRDFFNNCDGIFLNYAWNEENLQKSVEHARDRSLDVYVGVDVFGRNCYGGGGFNTCKALEIIWKQNLSVALFAPSWVHEYLGRSCFTELEYAFWQKLWPYLYVHGPTQLPFSTSFCQGYGKKLHYNGNVISHTPWYNLSKQNYQPTVPSCLDDSFLEPIVAARIKEDICLESGSDKGLTSREESKETSQENNDEEILAVEKKLNEEEANKCKEQTEEKAKKCKELTEEKAKKCKEHTEEKIKQFCDAQPGCIQHFAEDAFNGGGCLRILKPKNMSHQLLLLCNFHCTGITKVEVATKPVDECSATLNIILHLQENKQTYRNIVLVGKEKPEEENIITGEVYPIKQNTYGSGWMKRESKTGDDHAFFQQDSATAHIVNNSMRAINNVFPQDRDISRDLDFLDPHI